MLYQTTVKNRVYCSGVGLHTGISCNLIIRPAPADNGIVFVRQDSPRKGTARIPAHIDNVVDATLVTLFNCCIHNLKNISANVSAYTMLRGCIIADRLHPGNMGGGLRSKP